MMMDWKWASTPSIKIRDKEMDYWKECKEGYKMHDDSREYCKELIKLGKESNAFRNIREVLTYVYNQGYKSGHHDTVESEYVDVFSCDMFTYHDDMIDEIVEELRERGIIGF